MNSHPTQKPSLSGRTARTGIMTALFALGLTQIGCVVHSRPVYVVEQAPPPATTVVTASGDVVVDDFYAPLSNYGVWVYAPGYGRVWQPADEFAGPGFTPYASHGRWVVNEYGNWVFVSRHHSQWGWATYHYGRWAWTDYYGWVWVPGVDWAPSWVEWRYGGGYVGWAPMGPAGYVVVQEHWVFVDHAHVCAEGVVEHRLPAEQARTAYTAASPVIETKGDKHYHAGPSAERLAAAGVAIHNDKVQPPPAGYVRQQAKLVDDAAANRRVTGKVPSAPVVRTGATLPEGAGVALPPANRPNGAAGPAIGAQDPAGAQGRPNGTQAMGGQGPSAMPQPAPAPNNGVGRPMGSPQPMQPMQPSPMPQPMPTRPDPMPSRPEPMQPSVTPRPTPQPMPQPSRPTVSPPVSRPTPAPAPRPSPKPSPSPKPAGKRR